MPTHDLADVIARWRRYAEVHRAQDVVTVAQIDFAVLLDAAEAGMRARNEALEEAAAIAENKSREGCACHCVGSAIRARTAAALRVRAQEIDDDR